MKFGGTKPLPLGMLPSNAYGSTHSVPNSALAFSWHYGPTDERSHAYEGQADAMTAATR